VGPRLPFAGESVRITSRALKVFCYFTFALREPFTSIRLGRGVAPPGCRTCSARKSEARIPPGFAFTPSTVRLFVGLTLRYQNGLSLARRSRVLQFRCRNVQLVSRIHIIDPHLRQEEVVAISVEDRKISLSRRS